MYSKQSRAALRKAVTAGHRIAMAFNTKLIASDSLTIPDNMANFDKTDLRHLDGKVIGALTRKGSNKKQRAYDDAQSNSFFVTSANLRQFKDIIQTIGGLKHVYMHEYNKATAHKRGTAPRQFEKKHILL